MLWSIVFRSYLRIRLTASYIIYELSYLVCVIYGSVRRDLRDRQGRGDVEHRQGWDRVREAQIVSPRGKGQYIGGNKNGRPKKICDHQKKMGGP